MPLFLKALVVQLISNSKANNFSKSRKERATALNEIEKKCKEIRSAVDEIICEAMPPDADALAPEAKNKTLAEDMMKRVEEVLTGRDDTNDDDEMNHVDAAKKALAGVQLRALKCNCTRIYSVCFMKRSSQLVPTFVPGQTLLVYENLSFPTRGRYRNVRP